MASLHKTKKSFSEIPLRCHGNQKQFTVQLAKGKKCCCWWWFWLLSPSEGKARALWVILFRLASVFTWLLPPVIPNHGFSKDCVGGINMSPQPKIKLLHPMVAGSQASIPFLWDKWVPQNSLEELGFYNGSLAGNSVDTDGTVGGTGEIIGKILPASQDRAVLVCWG